MTDDENNDCYSAVVENAVSLTGDTDTIAKIAGEAAAVVYDPENIPTAWRREVKRPELLDHAVEQLADLIPDEL